MTATDELRRMLDKRGVKYEVDDAKTVMVTRWKAYGDWVSFIEYDNGETKFYIDARRMTPEQAIAATVGRGTCEADETETWEGVCMSNPIRYVRNLTIHVMECSECGHTYEHVNGDYEFCPRCGRKRVDG